MTCAANRELLALAHIAREHGVDTADWPAKAGQAAETVEQTIADQDRLLALPLTHLGRSVAAL